MSRNDLKFVIQLNDKQISKIKVTTCRKFIIMHERMFVKYCFLNTKGIVTQASSSCVLLESQTKLHEFK